MAQELFFPFLDGSLAYHCPTCTSSCCQASGIALHAQRELVQFASLSPRGAAFLRPGGEKTAELLHLLDGCWMLRTDGRCEIEVAHGHAAKPSICRLFPFNRLQQLGEAVLVGFNAALCPMQDASARRDGQSWAGLRLELVPEPLDELPPAPLPPGAREAGWLGFEAAVRDAIAAHLDEPDYASFAAWQEAAVLALVRGRPLPAPRSPEVQAREGPLRALLSNWRGLFGADADPGLPEAARKAARQAAVFTSSWRFQWLLRGNADAYTTELQRLPRQLLASSALVELAQLAQRRPAGLRVAMQTRLGTIRMAALLALFDQRMRLARPLEPIAAPPELRGIIDSLSTSLQKSPRPLVASLREGLAGAPPHLRALAFSFLANADAQLDPV